MGDALLPFPLTERSVDMQRIFSADGPWPAPWMERVLPVVATLAGRHPERTVFTRFIPPERPDQMPGMWQRYYTRWRAATRECLDLDLLELMPPLATLCPPATVIDKTRYSGFAEPKLLAHLREREADALIISGSETDVCVLATVLSAVDLGYGRHLPSPRHPDAARSCYEGTNGTRGARAGDARVWELVQS
jgi:nicotinamidase-related amidase